MNHLKNIAALKADYEAGINSKVDIANKKTEDLLQEALASIQTDKPIHKKVKMDTLSRALEA